MIYEQCFSIAHFSMLSSVLFPGLLTYFNLFSALPMWTLANINYSTHQKPRKGRMRIETAVKNLLLCDPRIKLAELKIILRQNKIRRSKT